LNKGLDTNEALDKYNIDMAAKVKKQSRRKKDESQPLKLFRIEQLKNKSDNPKHAK